MKKEKEKNRSQAIIKGPSLGVTDNFPKREMWKEIANELNGEFKIKHNSGNELEIHNISIPYKKWNINLDLANGDDTNTLPVTATYIIGKDKKISFVHFDTNYKYAHRASVKSILKYLENL